MSKLLSVLFNVGGNLSGRHDNDLTDRLVSKYSTSLFVALCVVVTSSTYVGHPIQCWCPAQFTSTHTDYANAHCLISPTYIAPFPEALPQEPEPERHINYYVWVPLILLCQAFLCALPSFLWRGCYRAAGVNVPGLVDRLNSVGHSLGWEHRDNAIQYVVHHISRYADGYRPVCCRGVDATCCCISKSSGNYLTVCYLFTKLLYVVVSVGQFVGLNWFLGFDFLTFGFDMMRQVMTDGDGWIGVERFPKVTICEFSVRHMHKVHTWVLQCVLPINLFNERIFLLIWFWLLALSVATLYSFCKWLCKSVFWRPQLGHVKSQLRFRRSSRPQDFNTAVVEFSTQYLRRDSLALLRLLAHNVGSLMEEEVLKGLWENFYKPKVAPASCPEAQQGVLCPSLSRPPRVDGGYCPTTLREVVAEVDRVL